MYLRKLTLTNMRAFRTAEFDFLGQPGVHLIVGVNGVGKSTALEALRVALTQLVPRFVATGVPVTHFDKEAITLGAKFLNVSLGGLLDGVEFSHILDYKPEAAVPNERPVGVRAPRKGASRLAKIEYLTSNTRDSARDGAYSTPNVTSFYLGENTATSSNFSGDVENDQHKRLNELQQKLKQNAAYPLAAYYSPHRSLFNNKTPGMLRKQLPAYYEALDVERIFSIKVFADWWRSRQTIILESKNENEAAKLSQLFKRVTTTFLDNCQDIHLAPDGDERHLLITKNSYQLSIKQLSDGERSILTLILDLARRLYLANPGIADPISNGQAIVLIDELDLHLHPGWQREVVQRLENTFQKCQFICSTHSAQIIGEVRHERVSALQLQEPQVFHPSQSFGMDTNWIIDVLMDAKPRNVRVALDIKKLFSLLAPTTLVEAKALLLDLRNEIGLGSSELSRAEASINRLERTSRETN